MDEITDNLLCEILVRLPEIRHAHRCADVCKQWSSLISSPEFANSFSTRRQSLDDAGFSAALLPLLVVRPVPDFHRIPFAGNKFSHVLGESQAVDYFSFLPWEDVMVRAYCGDLLLVSGLNGGRLSFCVCNPITKKYWCGIPEPPGFVPGDFQCVFTCRLGNRGRHNYHVTLFLDSYCPANELKTIDFSSEIGEWSSPTMVRLPMEISYIVMIKLVNDPVTCGDGLVYWLEGQYRKWKYVVEFDPLAAPSSDGHRHTRLIHRPPAEPGYETDMDKVRLGTFRGRLRAAYITDSSVLKVWELSRASASSCWSLVHDSALGFSRCTFFYPLALHSGDRNVIFLKTYDGCIFRYDMSSGTSQYVDKLEQDSLLISLYPLFSTWPTPVLSLQPK